MLSKYFKNLLPRPWGISWIIVSSIVQTEFVVKFTYAVVPPKAWFQSVNKINYWLNENFNYHVKIEIIKIANTNIIWTTIFPFCCSTKVNKLGKRPYCYMECDKFTLAGSTGINMAGSGEPHLGTSL